ncbi:ABC transporter ATP-binding protein [Campylobacter sp. FMV-PI01]|uniref:ABC transporter ATP-binding protein n=1 Tax=Campylobacter portucalensis TaxID=2608384 RepID=A0A6L5WIT2_9BACT|nr:ABC transporter ATP-binding protein [Campylobacter portucalensis]MSN96876.1 ABC transporter ATP-binding protein [Campylobacter portucalensis]
MISVKNLEFSYHKKAVLQDINFDFKNSLAILGENGCGKSTLLKCMLNLVKFKGEILFNKKDITKFSRTNLALNFAYIPQFYDVNFDYEVLDIVLLSRLNHKKFFENYSKDDYEICTLNLEMLGINHLKNRIFKNLSGGEKALVYLARALSTNAKIIFMDEPVSALDFGNQIKFLNLIKNLRDKNFILTSHHPRHIKYLGFDVLMLKNGKILEFGKNEILNPQNISKLYGVDYEKYKEIL